MDVLIIGDGNFSFSRSLLSHSEIGYITATSYDTEEELLKKYSDAASIIEVLRLSGSATVLHGIDCTQLPIHFEERAFCRAIFMHPLIQLSAERPSVIPEPAVENRIMLLQFLLGCEKVLKRPFGEVRITIKNVAPYTWWRTHTLSEWTKDLVFSHTELFEESAHPGYEPRNVGKGQSFAPTAATTFVFRFKEMVQKSIQPSSMVCLICEKPFTSQQDMLIHQQSKIHRQRQSLENKF
ncbi:unnamed protein product, partial [Heterosigma akashiwo]